MATTPILGLPLPNSSSTDQVPADLLTLMTAAEKFFVGSFADASTRAALITSPTAGILSYNLGTARYEYYDGSIWRPIPGTLIETAVGTVSAVTVTNPGDVSGFTSTITPATQLFPTRHEIDFGCLVTAAGVEQVSVALYKTGVAIQQRQLNGSGDKYGHHTEDVAASASAPWQGALIKQSGTTVATASTSGNYSFVKVRVYAA